MSSSWLPPSSSKTTSFSNDPQLTIGERNALARQSLNGQGRDPEAPVTPARTAPPNAPKQMSKPVFSAWNIPISSSQLEKLRNGFQPVEMEDRWLIYSDDDIDSGVVDSALEEKGTRPFGDGEGKMSTTTQAEGERRITVYMVRSWTGKPVYEIRVLMWRKDGGVGDRANEGDVEMEARITGLAWESDEGVITGQDENAAKGGARELCKGILGVILLPDVPRRRRGKAER